MSDMAPQSPTFGRRIYHKRIALYEKEGGRTRGKREERGGMIGRDGGGGGGGGGGRERREG